MKARGFLLNEASSPNCAPKLRLQKKREAEGRHRDGERDTWAVLSLELSQSALSTAHILCSSTVQHPSLFSHSVLDRSVSTPVSCCSIDSGFCFVSTRANASLHH